MGMKGWLRRRSRAGDAANVHDIGVFEETGSADPSGAPEAAKTAPLPDRCVRLSGVAHRFPGTDVLFERLDDVISPGEVVAVCGPSGCGKSTLLSIVAGWEKPWRGTVERRGIGRVGWVFQNPYGVAGRTALDHVTFPLLAKGLRRRDAEPEAMAALDLFDLGYAAGRRFSDLSGGEAQRLMLARAVCSRPDLLLVDEPTAQLDTRTAHSVSHVLGNLAGKGMIVMVATHDPDTRDACDRVIDLAHYAPQPGEIVDGEPSNDTDVAASATAGLQPADDGKGAVS
ncbi:ABC transporter ATP-binding protein [Bifidobacterium leontopitheci]|uniref:ABC transporter n=1 Tax=Bifidobacterium leontopitheci TaxID=2650774 RepID=A0A6I1GQC2_9BIFI|nr:ATP-binding cassette domain-containing protein [Bifidobacterium leontopitheci]KAB7791487.1 ABC transporter [Bifidobacterium leontopitheci]